ncbi:hypothetical protein DITRI_Ditri03aG0149000 [Diplodiscus trichospermus]
MQQNELGSDDDFKHNCAFQLQLQLSRKAFGLVANDFILFANPCAAYSPKQTNQHSSSGETNQAAPTTGDGSSLETETGAEHDGSSTASQSAGDTELVSKPTAVSETITTALANTRYTLEGAEVELALNPLRLAFETKNLMNKALSKE